jgi:Family of unknown function (DUF6328)
LSSDGDVHGSNTNRSTEDRLVRHYDTILKESALLTTFAGILFGFLLQISTTSTQRHFGYGDMIVLLIALFSITIAACLFIMPVVYHHLEYPYHDLEKFKKRSHRFIKIGLIHASVTLYLGLEIALTSIFDMTMAFLLALGPFVAVYIYFRTRK